MEFDVVKTLFANFLLSILAGFAAWHFIKQFIPLFMERKLFGYDQCKVNKQQVVEPIGVVAAAVYLIFIFIFIPISFYGWNKENLLNYNTTKNNFMCNFIYVRMLSFLASIVSICTAILLGFADDMLDLRWRHKLIFPTLSSLPLLLVYYVSENSTAMYLPNFIRKFFGSSYIDFGVFFYIYMIMLVIFCTNAINIIAGINGVEVGQSIVIASSVAVFNIYQSFRLDYALVWYHTISLCFLMPFISTSFVLYLFNKYPAKVFVGDTYCYWAGMTLAVAAISGRFPKTLLLFLIPQILNFVYSIPQLFQIIPCPRHRLPKLNLESGKLELSVAEFEENKLNILGKLILKILKAFRLIFYKEFEKEDVKWISINNLTILNFIIKIKGPLYEYKLTQFFLLFQLSFSIFAFVCRFYLSSLFYETIN